MTAPAIEPGAPVPAQSGAGAFVLVQPLGFGYTVPPGHSLLEAADAAGLRLPRSCRNGTCRACLAQLQAGSVHWRVDWPGVSTEERAEGWVLPCVAEAASAQLQLWAPGAQVVPGGGLSLARSPASGPGPRPESLAPAADPAPPTTSRRLA